MNLIPKRSTGTMLAVAAIIFSLAVGVSHADRWRGLDRSPRYRQLVVAVEEHYLRRDSGRRRVERDIRQPGRSGDNSVRASDCAERPRVHRRDAGRAGDLRAAIDAAAAGGDVEVDGHIRDWISQRVTHDD